MIFKTLLITVAILQSYAQEYYNFESVRPEYEGNINYDVNPAPTQLPSINNPSSNQSPIRNIDQQLGMLHNYLRQIDTGFTNTITLISENENHKMIINVFDNNTYDSIIGFIDSLEYPVNWSELSNYIPIIQDNENSMRLSNNINIIINNVENSDNNSYDFKIKLLNFLTNNKIFAHRNRDIVNRFTSVENIQNRIILLMKHKFNRMR